MKIRHENKDDHDAISETTIAAFEDYPLSQQTEHLIIDELRKAKILSGQEQIKIRLYGVDTPERKQPFGQAAKRKISAILTSSVTVEEKDVDRWGRTVGIVYASTGSNINEEMVKSGYAWVYRKYCRAAFCSDWLSLEASARENKIGLWKESAVPPWEYRKRK